MSYAVSAGSHGSSFERWWSAPGEWVEEPNQRRDGLSGVVRHKARDGVLYIKRQEGHTFRSLRFPLGRPTALREYQALAAFEQAGVCVPHVRFFGVQQDERWKAVMVTEALAEGFVSLEDFYRETPEPSPPQQQALLKAIAHMLARMHRAGWQHAGLYDKHLFVRFKGQGDALTAEAATLDLERARKRLTQLQAAKHDLRQLKRRVMQWGAADWAVFTPAYEQAFGRKVAI
ncbi:lipopolysaccharide kinase InaA family protein [Atopomonas sediminilitoris]|uniref:lipopolysaccharide kinase InaA family protein n=1 Tax=Atopomonas sediminilitoris TaxID=2919919 RepID=UPI001F4DEEBC|nr:lipopolysaccharide kinase InaA family protein [Atopomonas sediminilitoris]MCJ8169778.1 phosphotransferase [Atopomonas sediminilitoris]